MELEGKLIVVNPTQQVTDSFKKREFVIETSQVNGDRTFTEQIKFQLVQDKCDVLDLFPIGSELKVLFNIKGRAWTNKEGKTSYFNSLDAWKLEGLGVSDNPQPTQEEVQTVSDDLPF